jgi:glucose/arabinose dehydrogenase
MKGFSPRIIPLAFLMFWIPPLAACGSEGEPVVGPPPQQVEDTFRPTLEGYDVETWVEGLEVPWSLVFLSEEEALVSERPGRIRLLKGGKLSEAPYANIEVVHRGEGGLMGLAVHPEFPREPYVYAMHTYEAAGVLYNRVVRLRHGGDRGSLERPIIEKIPGHRVHNGGRIAFGPDGMLYICTGDIWQAELAQDRNSLAGKILRLTPEGEIPPDNPFEGSPVYSLGHRNPQGLAWHPETGVLFSSEHGPSGEFGLRGKDIINVIQKGGNYGWPRVVGKAGVDPYIDPIIMWREATPPGGMAFWNGDLFVSTLRSQALIRIGLEERNGTYEAVSIERWFAEDHSSGSHGRLRDAAVGPDNRLYVLTTNRDGRGRARPGDDRILRISPKAS